MSVRPVSRRAFTSTLGAGIAALASPGLPRALASQRHASGSGRTQTGIALDSNENPYGPSPRALAAMSQSLAVASRYPDGQEEALMAALARLHGVAPDQIVLGCGSGEVLKMADAAFLGPDRRVLCAEPTFEAVLGYAKVTRAEPVKVPLTPDHRHDLAAMAAACDPRTGLVYVCNPNNPTGTIVSADELDAFLKRVPKDTVVLVDEAYHHFVDNTQYRTALEWLPRHDNLVIVRTFSKVYGLAGMRLGYAVASKAKTDALRGQAIWSNGNAAVLDGALAMLEEPDFVAQQRARLNGTKRWLVEELKRDGRRYIPSEANFMMIDVGGDVAPLIAGFKARGMRVGRKFPALPNWLRITIGTDEEMKAFVTALRALLPVPAAA